MKISYLVVLLLCSVFSFGQFAYEKGYYVDATGTLVNGLIHNEEWSVAPHGLTFKKDANAVPIHLSLDEIQAFGAADFKYVKYTVAIDQNPSVMMNENGSKNGEPDFETKTLFLKVVVEGEAASLYSTLQDGYVKLFYKLSEQEVPTQLVYKRFRNDQGNQREIHYFRKELFDNVRCPDSQFDTYNTLDYTVASLEPIFVTFNECNNKTVTQYKFISKKFKLNITPFIGYGMISSSIEVAGGSLTYEDKIISTPVAGMEFSSVLPFNSRRLEIFSRVFVKHIKVSHRSSRFDIFTNIYRFAEVELDYTALNIFFGPRYYFDINTNGKFFLDASGGLDVQVGGDSLLHTYIYTDDQESEHNIKPVSNKSSIVALSFGAGYVYKKRYGFDLRYETVTKGDGLDIKQRGVTATFRYTIY